MNAEPFNSLPAGCNPACPGCSHRNMSMEESLDQKFRFIQKMLFPWKDLVEPVQSTVPEKRLAYRKKTILHADWNKDQWIFGMLHRDELIPIPDCPIHSPEIGRIIALLVRTLPGPGFFPLVFYVQNNKQLTLIIRSRSYTTPNWLTREVQLGFERYGLEGVWVHCNPSAGRRLFEKTPRVLVWGKAWSLDEQGMQYGPQSFQQLIPDLYHHSLQLAIEWLEPGPGTAVVDLYSGTGNSIKYWIKSGAETTGVELCGEAVTCAAVNVPEALILRGKCEERLPQLTTWMKEMRERGRKIVLYVNPPRTGVDPLTLEWIMYTLKPDRMAYLSCSPGTLGKNLHQLSAVGYEPEKIFPVDFFPLTRHVETLTLIKKMD
jgi:23S rRNA (uracil1939-C5)-methyltransferase